MTAVQKSNLQRARGLGTTLREIVINRNEDHAHEGCRYWRGQGGYPLSIENLEFDRQLDKVAIWLDQWDHHQRCLILEILVNEGNYKQSQLVWTVVQPAIHRDFMYTALKEFPSHKFVPISSYSSRKLKDKMINMRQENYYRLKSAHLQHYEQVQAVNSTDSDDKLLHLPVLAPPRFESMVPHSEYVKNWRLRPGLKKAHTVMDLKLRRESTLEELTRGSVSSHLKQSGSSTMHLDGLENTPRDVINQKPACIRFLEMPVRRHMQDERSPRFKEIQSTGDQLCIREWKRRAKEKKEQRKKKSNKHVIVKEPPSSSSAGVSSQLSAEAQKLILWFSEKWNDYQRNEFLHKFLLKLDPRQHYFVSSFLAFRQYRDFIGLLPENLAMKILLHLQPLDLTRGMRVNKTWNKLCNDNDLWRSKCEELVLDIPVISKDGVEPDWKQLFRENASLKNNWLSGKCEIIDCKGHKDRVLCVTFDDSRLITGSMDKAIKVWNIETGKCTQTLRGHQKGVWCLKIFTPNLLLSGSHDNTIKVWNLRTGECARTLISHEGPVWALGLRGYTLVSASQDKTAKVWDISRCLLLHTLESHTAAVFCVDLNEDGKLILTGSADRSVRMWESDSGKLLKIVWVSQTTSVMTLSYSKGYFATSYGTTICLYKRDGKLVKTFDEHHRRIETVELRITDSDKLEGTMVSGGKDGAIKYWDITKSKSVQNYSGHTQPVNCIHCDETRIASASYDNRVKIFDFNITKDDESVSED